MPIIIQKEWYTRQDIRNNPDKLYVWGDNLLGIGGANNPRSGQAFACRDEPNCIGIPTKRKPAMTPDSFFTDADYENVVQLYDRLFEQLEAFLRQGYTVVWPADGIGTGRAELAKRAPKIWNYLETFRKRLIEFD